MVDGKESDERYHIGEIESNEIEPGESKTDERY